MYNALTIEGVRPSGELTIFDPTPENVPAIDPTSGFFAVDWERVEMDAALVQSCPGVAPQFRESAANCRFIAYQSQRWGTDPVATAQKTYFMPRKGGGWTVGYEAQLIHALIEGDPMIERPLEFSFGYGKEPASAAYRYCEIKGWIRGAKKPAILRTPMVCQIQVKNSPGWWSNVDQQLSYFGVRDWARRYRPSRILGIYSRDEIATFRDTTMISGPIDDDEAPEGEAAYEGVPASADQGASFKRFEAKASGEQDSRDPRDAPANKEGDKPPPPNEPRDLAELREWAGAEQTRVMAIKAKSDMGAAWKAVIADKRWGRLKAYDPQLARTIVAAVTGAVSAFKDDGFPGDK